MAAFGGHYFDVVLLVSAPSDCSIGAHQLRFCGALPLPRAGMMAKKFWDELALEPVAPYRPKRLRVCCRIHGNDQEKGVMSELI